jgi:ABC-2 type transport system permease protein
VSARAAAGLAGRLVGRGAVLLWVFAAVYCVVEVLTYRRTYPTAGSREELLRLADDPTVRVLQGVPGAVDTVGGFVAWDAGWFLALVVGIWSLLATTRLLRADEDAGRAELVLSRPLTPTGLLLVQVAVLLAAVVAFGVSVAVTLLLLGLPPAGSVLLGAGLSGIGATSVGAGLVTAQLLDPRRRALAAAAVLLGLAFLVRMVASSAPAREGLLVATPFGWLDRLQPFGADRWTALLPLAVVPLALVAVAVAFRAGRDLGAGMLVSSDRRLPRRWLLGSAAAFGWRAGAGVLVAWSLGTACFGVVVGALVATVVDLLEDDSEYRRVLVELGVDVASPADGFLALMAASLALVFALQVSWRVGALRAEESSGRLEHLLVRPVVRTRWLSVSAALAGVSGALVVAAAGAGVWAGAVVSDARISAGQAFLPMLGTLPIVVLFCGLAVLAFGAVPRWTVALPVGVAVLSYLLDLLGPLLDLPAGVVGLSPFAGLPAAPAEELSAGWVTAVCSLGLLAAAGGVVAFGRRDVTGE